MKMYMKSVVVDDQDKALAFYTEKLGFQVKHNMPLGEYKWLTVVSPEEPDGVELLLEPNAYPAGKTFYAQLKADGMPSTAFQVDDIEAEVKRLQDLGVEFTRMPVKAGGVIMAIFDDTCGNNIQLVELVGGSA